MVVASFSGSTLDFGDRVDFTTIRSDIEAALGAPAADGIIINAGASGRGGDIWQIGNGTSVTLLTIDLANFTHLAADDLVFFTLGGITRVGGAFKLQVDGRAGGNIAGTVRFEVTVLGGEIAFGGAFVGTEMGAPNQYCLQQSNGGRLSCASGASFQCLDDGTLPFTFLTMNGGAIDVALIEPVINVHTSNSAGRAILWMNSTATLSAPEDFLVNNATFGAVCRASSYINLKLTVASVEDQIVFRNCVFPTNSVSTFMQERESVAASLVTAEDCSGPVFQSMVSQNPGARSKLLIKGTMVVTINDGALPIEDADVKVERVDEAGAATTVYATALFGGSAAKTSAAGEITLNATTTENGRALKIMEHSPNITTGVLKVHYHRITVSKNGFTTLTNVALFPATAGATQTISMVAAAALPVVLTVTAEEI